MNYKKINGYEIYKDGTWCEVIKDGKQIFNGNVDEKMTLEQIYQEIRKKVVFSRKDIKVTIEKPTISSEIEVKFIGIDNWDRPVYKDKNGKLFKDVNLGIGVLNLCSSSNNDFYGEPEESIDKDIKIKIVKEFNKNRCNKEGER